MSADALLIDGGIGETRMVLLDKDAPVAVRIWRESDAGRRARYGEFYVGRVSGVDPRRRGAFIALGLSEEVGFLPIERQRPAGLSEGARVCVEIVREGVRGKGPVVRLRAEPGDGEARRLDPYPEDLDLASAKPASPDVRARIDAIVDQAMQPACALAGGGALFIAPTPALVAIDVDAQGRGGSSDGERFALDLNLEAGRQALQELRLRNLGGLIAIDFVNLRTQTARDALEKAMRAQAAHDPWGLQTARLSRFGVMEMRRGQMLRPLHEVMCADAQGAWTAETAALAALRRLQSEAATARGRAVCVTVAASVKAWLDAENIAWRTHLERQIGTRWTLEGDARFDVARIEARWL